MVLINTVIIKLDIIKKGYDHQGFDKNGYDKNGYDCNGFDIESFDKHGRDHEGYDKHGYDKDEYDRSGKDDQGFYRTGFNSEGIDRGGKLFNYYIENLSKIDELLNRAHIQMKKSELAYALHDIRIGLEKGMKCIIIHWLSTFYIKENLDANITTCKNYELLSRDFIEKLYDAKNHCNPL